MKRAKTFAKVVYYLVAIIFGVLMCLFLPYLFLYDGESMNMIEEALVEGRPADAMALVGGYYKAEPVLMQDLPNGGKIVLFESATLYEHVYGEGDKAQTKFKLQKSYAGFVYNVGGIYNTRQEQNNQTVLKVDCSNGQFDLPLLNTNTNNDDKMDVISTLIDNGFFFVELDQTRLTKFEVTQVNGIKFIDKDGNVFAELSLPQEFFGASNLFATQFFNDVDSAVAKYNQIIDYEVNNAEDQNYQHQLEALSKELGTLDAQLIEKGYSKSTTSIARSRADKLATITIVCYIIGVLIIGDFLVGPRYILRFIKWFLVKVCKVDLEKLNIKRKGKKQEAEVAEFGSDYFCQVRFELNEQDREGHEDEVKVTYTSEKQSVTFVLNNQNKYADLQRVQKDVLKLTEIESLNSISYNEIPDLLVVEGFNKLITIKK